MSIPNTLTIFINTRIRGYPKIRYEPDMTVPNIKSDAVYFNPLIKLNKSVVLNVPTDYQNTEQFTQFFNKSDFNGLVGRNIVSRSQQKLTLEEATKEGIVDNNIKVTLDVLFKKYNKFYIKGQPYSIYAHEWINGDWQVDKKSFERTILQSTYGQGLYGYNQNLSMQNKLADDEFDRFKKEHSDASRGFAVTSELSKFRDEYGNVTARGLPGTTTDENTNAINELEEEERKNAPGGVKKILKKLVYQDAINLGMDANLSNDPVSLSLIYAIDRNYSEDIKLNRKILEPLYKELLAAGEKYKQSKENYDNSIGSYFSFINLKKTLSTVFRDDKPSSTSTSNKPDAYNNFDIFNNKTNYDMSIKNIKKLFKEYSDKGLSYNDIISNASAKEQLLKILILLENYKKNFLISFLSSLKLLLSKIKTQIDYIRALYTFYTQLYFVKEKKYKLDGTDKVYQNILMLNIIKFDMQCYRNVINSIESNNNNTLSKNYKNIINIIKRVDAFIKTNNSTPKNYAEMLNNYFNFPQLLNINRYQLDVCMLTLLKCDYINELGIWKILYNQSDLFLKDIKGYIIGRTNDGNIIEGKITTAMLLRKQYSEKYSDEQHSIMYNNFKNLNMPLQSQNPHILDFMSPESTLLKTQLNDYIKVSTAITLCYDLISTYARTSAIKHSREISLLSARQNLSYINEKIYTRMGDSYSLISELFIIVKNNYGDLNNLLPTYIFLDKSAFNNDKASEEIRNQEELFYNNKNAAASSIKNYKNSITDLTEKYNSEIDALIPEISKTGVLENCYQILSDDNDKIKSKNSNISYDELTKELFKSYDEENTDIFKPTVMELYESAVHDEIIDDIEPDALSEIVDNWNVINVAGEGDCFFLAVADIFNYQLKFNGKKSNNFFTENGYYTNLSLRNAVATEITDAEITDTWGWTNSEEMRDASPDDPARRDFNFLFDEDNNWIGADFNAVRQVIRQPLKYWGDQRAILVLERVFKVKLVIIDTTIPPEPFPIGTKVDYKNARGQPIICNIKKVDLVKREYTLVEYYENDTVVVPFDKTNLMDYGYYRTKLIQSDDATANEYKHYAFLLYTELDSGAAHYEFIYNSLDNQFVYTFDEIPEFLKYLVFRYNWQYLSAINRRNQWYYHNTEFKNYLNQADKLYKRSKLGAHGGGINDDNSLQTGGQTGGQISSRNRYVNVYNTNSVGGDSKLSYYVIVDLELYPGESIPLLKQPVIACHLRYEKIRQAYADMFGLVYHPIDFYQKGHISPSSVKYRKPEGEKEKEYRVVRNDPVLYNRPNYNTRRFNVSQYGGKQTRRLR